MTRIVLGDGGVVQIRPISPDDADRLRSFHEGLSDRSRYFRFFSPHPRLSDEEVARFTTVDGIDRVALVGVVDGQIVAVGRYDRLDDGSGAEVAFVVTDRHQGRGLAGLLLQRLAAGARRRGVHRFTAEVLPHNRAMLAVFDRAGFPVTRRFADGVVHVELDITAPVPATVGAS